MHDPQPTRRGVLRGAGLSLASSSLLATAANSAPRRSWKIDDTLRVGIIGSGRRGHNLLARLGYRNAYANNPDKYLEGVKVVAVSDTWEGNREMASEAIGKLHSKPTVYRDYREMLGTEDLDAVIVATPDFTHAPISIAAIEAGCDVYVEKCAANTREQLEAFESAIKKHEAVVQVGYQLRQDAIYKQAAEVIRRGWIGEPRLARCEVHRNGMNGALRHPALADGGQPNPEGVDWELFLAGLAPEREYDPQRFFEWRKYWDYCNGICGDNQSHSVDAVEFVVGLGHPSKATAAGGVFEYDHRETPDVLTATVDYDNEGMSVLFVAIDSNSYNVPGTYFYGTEGTMHVSWELKVWPDRFSEKYGESLESGKLKASKPMIHLKDPAAASAITGNPSEMWLAGRGATRTTRKDRDGTFDTTRLHLENWFESIRTRSQPMASIESAKGSTMAAIMSAESYRTGRRVSASDLGF